MATPTHDRRDLLTVVAYMNAAPGKTHELKAALEALIEPASQEAGYVNYHENGLTINRVRRIA